jgi:glycosyltransferase involved in cell wall biosynthesis
MSEAQFPRGIIISQEIPQSINAGSILLRRLFLGYPADRILVIGEKPQPGAEILPCRYETVGCCVRRLETTRFSRIPRTMDALGVHRVSDGAIEKLVGHFQPDVVLTVMQSLSFYGAAWRYARKHKLPFALIVHDLPEEFEKIFRVARPAQRRVNRRIYNYATRRFCISPQMRDYLAETYGAIGDVLYPNRSEDLHARPLEWNERLRNGRSLTVGYAGSLAYGYGPQLANMVPVFEQTGSMLRIYSRSPLPTASPAVQFAGYARAEVTWSRIQEECDAVILPYAFEDKANQLLYQTHFPSKLPEYLALGMPVIVTGPTYATGVRWAKNNPDAALLIESNSRTAVSKALQRLRDSTKLRMELSSHAFASGNRDFDPVHIRKSFVLGLADMVRIRY